MQRGGSLKNYIIVFCLALLPCSLLAQKSFYSISSPPALNVIHGTAGTFLPLAVHLSFRAAYERKIPVFKSSERFELWGRLGTGYTLNWTDELFEIELRPVLLIGKNSSRFEFAAGAGLFQEAHSTSPDIVPGANIGYRYQVQEGNGFVFRTGIGLPEGAYVSFGYCF